MSDKDKAEIDARTEDLKAAAREASEVDPLPAAATGSDGTAVHQVYPPAPPVVPVDPPITFDQTDPYKTSVSEREEQAALDNAKIIEEEEALGLRPPPETPAPTPTPTPPATRAGKEKDAA